MAYAFTLDQYVPKFLIDNKTCAEMVISIRDTFQCTCDYANESILNYAIYHACTSTVVECPEGKLFAKEVRSFLLDAFKARSVSNLRTDSTPKKLVEKLAMGRNWVDADLIERLVDFYKVEAKQVAKGDRKEKRKINRKLGLIGKIAKI